MERPRRITPEEEMAAAEAWKAKHAAELAVEASVSVKAKAAGITTDLDPTALHDVTTYIRITDDSDAILRKHGAETEL